MSGELATALEFLQYQRDGVIRNIDGLSIDVALRPGVPSGTNLAWIVQHLVAGERHWLADDPVDDWEQASAPPADATVDGLVAAYRAAAHRSDAALAASTDLGGEPLSLRWRLLHMIEETARHAGHADILREQIDGSTGR